MALNFLNDGYFAGKVGIGTDSPLGELHVKNVSELYTDLDGSDAAVNFLDNNSDVWRIGIRASDNSFRFSQDATSLSSNVRFTIADGGNVGIGTDSPAGLLEIAGNTDSGNQFLIITDEDATAGSSRPSIRFRDQNTQIAQIVALDTGVANEGKLRFSTGNNEDSKLEIIANGNVGIGTTSPDSKLDVTGGDITVNTSGTGFMNFKYGAVGSETARGSITTDGIDLKVNATADLLLLPTGNVGIGTTSPAYKLSVAGTFQVKDANSAVVIQEYSSGATIWMDGVDGDFVGGDYFNISAYGATDLAFGHSAATKMTLKNTGNLGIGTTSPAYKLDVAGTGNFTGLVSGITPVAAANFVTKAYVDGSGGGTGPFLPLAGGTMTGTNGVTFPDNFKLKIGTGSDLQIYNDGGSTNIIDSFNMSSMLFRQHFLDGDMAFQSDDGSGGVTTYFFLDGSDVQTRFLKDLRILDDVKLLIGNGNDLQIYHDGSNSYIKDSGSGNLWIQGSTQVNIGGANGEIGVQYVENAGVGLRHNNVTKLGTSSTGVTVTGAATATTFLGDLNGTINTATTGVTQVNAIDNTTIATTAYVNNKIGLIPAGLVFQGTWNASTNTPTLTSGSGTTGNFYIVSVAGSTNLDGITDWKVGDWAVFIEQGASDQWEKIDNSSVLDGIGTGQTLPLWAGSGTSNTLTDSKLVQNTAGTLITAFTNSLSNTGTFITNSEGGGEVGLTVQSRTNRAKLRVADNDSNAYVVAEAGKAFFGTSANGDATNITVLTSGNVGIGTTSPTGKLDVVGSLVTARVLTTGSLSLIGTDATASAQTVLTISTGVGNATGPNIVLSKSRSQSSGAVVANDPLGTIQFQGGNGTASVEGARIQSIAGSTWSSTNRDSDLLFWTTPSGSTTIAERMRITSDGNVGIGTDSPVSPLVVKGTDVGATDNIAVQNSTGTKTFSVSNNGQVNIDGSQKIVTSDASIELRNNATGLMSIKSASNYGITFGDNGGETMRINTSTNNVGIGTTLPQSKLQVAGGIQMADDTDTAVVGKVGTMRYRTATDEPVPVTGTELIINGDFAVDANWTLGANSTISGGSLNSNSAGVYVVGFTTASAGVTGGLYYSFRYTITVTSGSIRLGASSGIWGDAQSTSGTYTGVQQAAAGVNGKMYFSSPSSDFVGSIDDVSIIEVTLEDASYADMCMQTGSSTYEWVNIVRNTY